MKTITTWKEGHTFTSRQEENTITLDGDKINGFSPKALLLSAVACCSGIDVVDILNKMKVEFSSLRVEAQADQTEAHPKVFKEIDVIYFISTNPANESKVRKAIDLSLDKYCGVAAMLKKNSAIRYKIAIE